MSNYDYIYNDLKHKAIPEIMKHVSTTLLTTLALSVPAGMHAISPKSDPINVLFIAVDDLKPIMGCYGAPIIQTPNIDALASSGTLFTRAYCQQAVSGPSRASLLTGRTPDHTRIWDLEKKIRDMSPDVITLPQAFREAGYITAGVGKIYHHSQTDKGQDWASWSIPYMDLKEFIHKDYEQPACGHYQDEQLQRKTKRLFKMRKRMGWTPKQTMNKVKVSTECMDVPNDAYHDGASAKAAIDFLNTYSKHEYDEKKPFFLAVGFKRPHLPFVAPKKYWDMYKREEMPLATYRKRAADSPEWAYHSSGELKSYTDIPDVYSYNDINNAVIEDAKARELIHGYYACVSYIDDLIGDLLKTLEKKNLRKNTVVILWGDHGWHLGDHGLWNKHTNFEQATHVPMIISVPGLPVQRVNQPVEYLDIYPTLLKLADVKVPQEIDGDDLSPVLMDGAHKLDVPYAVSQYPRKGKMGYSFRTERYRYTVWTEFWRRKGNPKRDINHVYAEELYDYQTDSLETKNLANNPEYKQVLKTMRDYWKVYKEKHF